MVWHGKTVLVTGGASGIGSAACRRFAKEGANVVVIDRDPVKADETVRAIGSIGGCAIAATGNAASEQDVRRMVAQAVEQFGAIDVLVNCAAVCPQARLTDLTLEQWNEVMANNLTSVFLCAREVIPHMLAGGGGAIVNVSSVHAVATLDGYSAYAASKGGVLALTRAMALDYAKQNIRVNAVLPGAVHTPMLEASIKNLSTPREEIMKTWNESQPLGRVGQPDEIAAVIVFAASPENSFMTGAALVADGGMTADL
jgi:NAD(P)-dependent dehydrogenase (short-subunit alcohol dehydrogenase family)